MSHIYDNVDLRWTWNGDLSLDGGNDLADTTSDYLLSLVQDIHTVSASALQDWEIYPALGAGLDDFMGEPNIRETADAIHDRLRMSLTSLGVVAEEDLNITVMPVHIHRVLVVIKVNAVPTPWNGLSEEEALVTYLAFDYIEHGIVFYEQPPTL